MTLTSLAACGGTTSGSGIKSPSDVHVGFVSATTNADFAVEMAMGAQYAANQYHVNAQIVAPTSVDGPAEVRHTPKPSPSSRSVTRATRRSHASSRPTMANT